MNTYTGLQSIHLQNYRCFADLTVELDKSLTVLVANNGAGKTTVLDAIAAALSVFVGPFQKPSHERKEPISESDILLKVMDAEVLGVEAKYPCSIKTLGRVLNKSVTWVYSHTSVVGRSLDNPEGDIAAISNQLKSGLAHKGKNSSVILPVIAHYGTERRWGYLTDEKAVASRFDVPTDDSNFLSRTAGYKDCLDSNVNYDSFVEWFRYATQAHNELRDKNIEQYGERGLQMETPYLELLNGINRAIDICLKDTGWHNLRYSSIHLKLVAEHKERGILPVSQLSDGIRNMIAMIADIAYRAVRLNKQFKADAPQKSPGIILIDEVDMHLHPKWQQRVLTQLLEAFPMMQFIVTTHSPQVLSTISSEHIRLLTKNIDGESIAAIPMAESYARTNADVMHTVMNVDPMPEVKESAELRRYENLIEQGDLQADEVQTLRTQLEETLGKNHPELMRLDTVKRRRELLG